MAFTTFKTSGKSDKLQDEHNEDTKLSRNDALYNSPAANHEESITQEKAAARKGGISKVFSKLGNLPEWSIPGHGQLRGEALNNSIAWASCLAFLMFGYDQGVMSGLLTLDDFQRHFPLMTPLSRANSLCWLDSPKNTVRDDRMCTGNANTQAAAVALYQVGCFLGAVLILFYGEVWGRKSSTFWGSFIMVIGTIFQIAAGGSGGGDASAYAVLIVGRVIGGVGNGMVTSSTYFIAAQIMQSNIEHYSYTNLAVRVRKAREARKTDHYFWCHHCSWCHDFILGRLWILLPPCWAKLQLGSLEVSGRFSVILHYYSHVKALNSHILQLLTIHQVHASLSAR